MIYCLMTEDKKLRVEISCTMANKPTCTHSLLLGINDKTINLLKGTKKSIEKYIDNETGVDLDTDWERTGVGGRYINWIPTENL